MTTRTKKAPSTPCAHDHGARASHCCESEGHGRKPLCRAHAAQHAAKRGHRVHPLEPPRLARRGRALPG